MKNQQNEAKTDDAGSRFQWVEKGELIGFIEYYPFERVVIVTHTEVRSEMEGKGYGSELARRAVAYFQAEGKEIVPVCGFFAQFLRKHPEYTDAVTPEGRRIFNL